MTPKEALEKILSYVKLDEYDYVTSGVLDAEQLIKQALTSYEELKKRDTPMKWIDVVDETGHYDKCPVCGYPSYNDLGHNHFCTVCGQRLEFDEKVGNEE